MRPRAAYRVAVVAIAFSVAILVVALIEGSWLLAVLALIMGPAHVYNLRRLHAQGVGWNGPRTFRELRERERAD